MARRAFSLLELLVVIGVIAVLIGLLLPTLARARQAGMSLACSSNLRQWASAAVMYANQNDGWLPRRGQGAQATTVINRPSDWFNALPPMLRLRPLVDLVAESNAPRPGDGSVWMCPSSMDAGQKYFFAYAMNMRLSTWQSSTPDRISRIGSWSTVVFMTEGPGVYCSVLPDNADYSPVARHNKRINIAFLDGHVSSYDGAEIGCGVGDPRRADVRWVVPYSTWVGPRH
ncbi:MAG: prepilin-type N-terminal cleavage/methylation domain-containing protein [Tepidisphaeraceae bacterium]